MWKLAGARLDGWKNSDWPTERVPGDKTSLPSGASIQLADLDYADTANHASMLTPAEQRLITTWIDVGAPIDLGGGYWQDEIRPTLALTISNGQLIVGAADAYSGLDAASLSVTINGSRAKLQPLGDGRWETPLKSPTARIVASVKDRAGNWTELAKKASATSPRATANERASP
jgi:hypothetical protein